jgi:hypothetical protein
MVVTNAQSEVAWMPVLLTMLVASSVATADIRPLLVQQGFDGPVNGREKITYVGHISQGPNDFQIYLYHGIFRAAVVDHGVNKLIVILNGSTFFGEYTINQPRNCKVRLQKVICNTDDPRFPAVIAFTRRGPPKEIWFDGEIHGFVLARK